MSRIKIVPYYDADEVYQSYTDHPLPASQWEFYPTKVRGYRSDVLPTYQWLRILPSSVGYWYNPTFGAGWSEELYYNDFDRLMCKMAEVMS